MKIRSTMKMMTAAHKIAVRVLNVPVICGTNNVIHHSNVANLHFFHSLNLYLDAGSISDKHRDQQHGEDDDCTTMELFSALCLYWCFVTHKTVVKTMLRM